MKVHKKATRDIIRSYTGIRGIYQTPTKQRGKLELHNSTPLLLVQHT